MKISQISSNGTVGIRPRIQLGREDFVEALRNLPDDIIESIMDDLGALKEVDHSSAVAWFKDLDDSDRHSFLKDIGIQALQVEVVDIDIIPVSSSFISGYGYDEDNNRLQINMSSGSKYQYLHVPQKDFNKLLMAGADVNGSVGRAYNRVIKGKYNSITL